MNQKTPRNPSNKISKFSNLPQSFDLGNKEISLSYLEYLWYLIAVLIHKTKTKKQQLIKKAEDQFNSEMDIVNILTGVHEIEKLKVIVLDSDQLVLFNHLTKPLIYINQTDFENSAQLKMNKMRMLRKNEGKNHFFHDSYNKVANANSLINNRIIEFIEET